MKNTMNKKGQAEQFNWLFVIIAGAIVLSFFAVFTSRYVTIQEKRQSATIAKTLSENIQLLQASTSKEHYLDDSAFSLGVTALLAYTCNKDESSLTVDNQFTQDLKNEVVFAPTTLRTDALDAWIYSWNYPYFITPLLYFSDPTLTYFLIYDRGSRDYVQGLDLPKIFTVIRQDKDTPFDPRAARKARIIYFTQPSQQDLKTAAASYEEASILSVDTQQEYVIFYEGTTPSQPIPYYGEALLYGAFFTSTPEQYTCSLSRATRRLKRTTAIYSTKALLLNQAASGQACDYSTLQQALTQYATTFPRNSQSLSAALIKINEALGGHECPTVF